MKRRGAAQRWIVITTGKTVRYLIIIEPSAEKAIVFSKVSVKSQTVIPRQVRDKLGLRPGDTLRYRLTAEGILIDKAPRAEAEDPFVIFTEWSSEVARRPMPSSDVRRLDPFEVVIVPFPYSGRLAEKRRPAVVISNRKLSPLGLTWLAMITSAENPS